MIHRRNLVVVLAAGAIVACGSGETSAGSRDGAQDGAQPGSGRAGAASSDTTVSGADAGDAATTASVPATCDDLHYEILKVPATRQAFATEFGPPDSVTATVEPNRHVPGATDSLFTVHYPGLVMDIRTPPGARDMATHVRVTNNRYLAFPGIGPGTAAARVEEVLGEPLDKSAGYLRYQCSEDVEQPVTFRISAGRVSAVEIDYYVD